MHSHVKWFLPFRYTSILIFVFAGNILLFVWMDISCHIYSLSAIFCFCFLHFFCSYDSMFVSITVARIVCHYFAFFFYLTFSLCFHFNPLTCSSCHLKFTQCAAIMRISFILSLSNTDPTLTLIHTCDSNVLNVSYVFVAKQWQKYHGATNECDSIIMWRSMNKTKIQTHTLTDTHPTANSSRRHDCQVGRCERHTHSALPFDILSHGSLA